MTDPEGLPGGPWTYDEFLQDVYAPDGVGVQLIAGNVKSHIGKAIASIPAMVEEIGRLRQTDNGLRELENTEQRAEIGRLRRAHDVLKSDCAECFADNDHLLALVAEQHQLLDVVRIAMKNRDRSEAEEMLYSAVCTTVAKLETPEASIPAMVEEIGRLKQMLHEAHDKWEQALDGHDRLRAQNAEQAEEIGRLRASELDLENRCRSYADFVLENDRLREQNADYEEVLADKRRLTRELDIAMHGEDGAAQQASLCDLIEPANRLRAQNEELIDLIKGMDAEGDIDATTIASLRAQNAELRAALKEAIDVVKIFHGPPAWDIYESRAPEMQRWKAALAKSQESSCEPQS